jgi:hypothetical protein
MGSLRRERRKSATRPPQAQDPRRLCREISDAAADAASRAAAGLQSAPGSGVLLQRAALSTCVRAQFSGQARR